MGDHATKVEHSTTTGATSGSRIGEAFWTDAARGQSAPLVDPRIPGVKPDHSAMLSMVDTDDEIVVSRARGLTSSSSTPSYSEFAGRGLGVAKANALPVADRFLRACAELGHVALFAQTLEGDWTRRLEQLVAVKRQILGDGPGDR